MRGDLVEPPRARNAAVPAPINDIVMKALSPDVGQRYQRASARSWRLSLVASVTAKSLPGSC